MSEFEFRIYSPFDGSNQPGLFPETTNLPSQATYTRHDSGIFLSEDILGEKIKTRRTYKLIQRFAHGGRIFELLEPIHPDQFEAPSFTQKPISWSQDLSGSPLELWGGSQLVWIQCLYPQESAERPRQKGGLHPSLSGLVVPPPFQEPWERLLQTLLHEEDN